MDLQEVQEPKQVAPVQEAAQEAVAKSEENQVVNPEAEIESSSEPVEKEVPAEEKSEVPVVNQAEGNSVHESLTLEQLVDKLKDLLADQSVEIRQQVEQLKTAFYRQYKQEVAAMQKKAEEASEELSNTVVDGYIKTEEAFRSLMNEYKQRRQQEHEKTLHEQAENLQKKEAIIEELKTLSESEMTDVMTNLQRVRQLQQDWKNIGAVPPTDATRLWKEYNNYQEKFYDLLKINNELREYDFKKNLEAKTALCEEAEKLTESNDIVSASRSLQRLHDEWANIGPVARDLREQIWTRFKTASTIINKKHQDFFNRLHAQENDNLQLKQGLIDELKQIDLEQIKTSQAWEEATKQVNDIQQRWRQIGFAPRKQNQAIYDEYRALCDAFFKAKSDYFRSAKETAQQNLQKKYALIEKAEALKDSTEWKSVTDQLVKLQQEWKTVGPVARKYSDEVWKRFTAACDHFFEQKKQAGMGQRSEERENLQKKKAIIEKIEAIDTADSKAALEELQKLQEEYAGIGFVPFKEKDKVQEAYRNAVNKVYDALQIDAESRRMERFEKNLEQKDENALSQDRRKLVRQYEALQQDIKTAENNILFFSSSKGSNKLVDDMKRKIEQQKKQLKDLENRINLIDEKLG
ncbi:MAG: DUF349 domain-containing protein [Paludibacteraceae bacterium]|nr:DUF349 domain-containing protein [Paludibacteraceae bacterium]